MREFLTEEPCSSDFLNAPTSKRKELELKLPKLPVIPEIKVYYDPLAMQEDYFFPHPPHALSATVTQQEYLDTVLTEYNEKAGNSIEVRDAPIEDLAFFTKRLTNELRIPHVTGIVMEASLKNTGGRLYPKTFTEQSME